MVGTRTRALTQDVDARWLMAYAASLQDLNPMYMDTAMDTVIAHPVFPVCLEWPVILAGPETTGIKSPTAEENARAVHAAHDLHIHRPIRAGDRLVTQGTIVNVRQGRAGAVSTSRLDTTDERSGELVVRTYQTGIFRDVAVEGGDRSCEDTPGLPELPTPGDARTLEIDVPAGAAHRYTECARIWNPIHTDRSAALAAGLPDIILHGTATLALAVSRIVDTYADGDPTRVRRLGCRFTAMVLMPSTLRLESTRSGSVVSYQVRTDQGEPAISSGYVCLDS